MELTELLASAKTQSFDKFEQKLNVLVRDNYHYKNLSEDNKQVVINFIKKHLGEIHRGQGISSVAIDRETYRLYENRLKLKLTENDLRDIKEIYNLFRK